MKAKRVSLLMVSMMLALTALVAFSGVAAAAGRGPGQASTSPQAFWGNGQSGGPGRGAGGGGIAQGTLTEAEIESLNLVLQDEYHAWAVYDQVIQDFGQVIPFTAIREAEARHAAAVERLFEKYGLDVPENQWVGNAPSFDSLEEACAAAVQAEIDNAGLYDTALATTTRRDLTNVFTNLQSASLNKHLPAFQACAAQ